MLFHSGDEALQQMEKMWATYGRDQLAPPNPSSSPTAQASAPRESRRRSSGKRPAEAPRPVPARKSSGRKSTHLSSKRFQTLKLIKYYFQF